MLRVIDSNIKQGPKLKKPKLKNGTSLKFKNAKNQINVKNVKKDKTSIKSKKDKIVSTKGKSKQSSQSACKNDYLLQAQTLPVAQCDVKFESNDLLFVEGTFHIFQYLKEREKDFQTDGEFPEIQDEVTDQMRRVLVDWLAEIHERMDLIEESLFLSVSVLDRFMQREKVVTSSLQLVGATCLFVAAKYEDKHPMAASDLVFLAKNSFSKEDIYKMERKILRVLSFHLTVPYSLTFARRFLRVANATRFERRYSEFLLQLALLDPHLSSNLPSKVASAAVFVTLRFNNPFIDEKWPNHLQKHTGFPRGDLKPLASRLLKLVHRYSSRDIAVFRKFSRQKFGAIAKIPLKSLMANSKRLLSKEKDGEDFSK